MRDLQTLADTCDLEGLEEDNFDANGSRLFGITWMI
jgi:hypothetical protein